MDLFTPSENTPVPSQDNDTDIIEATKAKFTKDGTLDVDALLKKAAHADKHIQTLEIEALGQRKELDTRLSLQQFLDEIKSTKTTSNSEHQPEQNESASVSRDELKQMLHEEIRSERSQAQKDYNKAQVADGLRKAWGNSFQGKLQEKANELGLSKEFVNSIAETNPKAFLKLVDAQASVREIIPDTAPPRSQRTSTTDTSGGKRDYKFYSNLRKTNPGLYQKSQMQMHNDALAQGDDFYN